jgi:hypothetical protein
MSYLVFCGSAFYASGGANDFLCDVDSAEDALNIARSIVGRGIADEFWHDGEIFFREVDWANVLHNGEVIFKEGSPHGDGHGVNNLDWRGFI